eukprot:TRINITY_DN5292_c0_g1_i1.p1 TRINITY_DN5292_c0_g1~~TRINITY_DN5292_c0_g1_i1.p1  ORF type:complete len:480 (-),score=103.67 TRINITY_DN5292_c0_g1_i1:68-1507(-)
MASSSVTTTSLGRNPNVKSLKVVVIDATLKVKQQKQKLSKTVSTKNLGSPRKDTSAKGKQTSSITKGFFVRLQILDSKGTSTGDKFSFDTKVLASKLPIWNQSNLFPLPRDTMKTTHKFLMVCLYKIKGPKQKLLGQSQSIDLSEVEEGAKLEKDVPILGGKPGISVKVTLGWYGTSLEAKQATAEIKKRSYELEMQEIVQKILKYERELAQLKTEMNEATTNKKAYERVLGKYRDIDDDARELVAPEVPRGYLADNSALYTKFKETGTAFACAAFMEENLSLEHLPEIKTKIFSSGTNWLKQFLEHKGFNHVMELFHASETQGYYVEMGVKVAQLASVIKSLMNDQVIAEEIIMRYKGDLKSAVKLTLASENPLVRGQMLSFFAALCVYGQASHEIILNTILSCDAEYQPFYSLVQIVKNERDREVITSTMMLLNAILAGEKEIGVRQKLRNYMLANDLINQMDHLREHLSEEKYVLS